MYLDFFSNNTETTDWCNRRCSFCPNSVIEKAPEFMSWGMFDKIVSELRQHHYKGRVHLYQRGEPLLDERLEESTVHVRRMLPSSRIFISTNGDFLNRKRVLSLMRAGMSEIWVSHYDGPNLRRSFRSPRAGLPEERRG